MKHFFSKLPAKIGSFLLASLLLVGMVVVSGTGLYMSWEHTYDLATNNGMSGSHATAYTLFAEVILAISEIVVIFKSLMKKKIHWSVYLGMGFGLIITATSNIISLGFLMGISIPIGTAIASLIFASALIETANKVQPTEEKQPAPTEIDQQQPITITQQPATENETNSNKTAPTEIIQQIDQQETVVPTEEKATEESDTTNNKIGESTKQQIEQQKPPTENIQQISVATDWKQTSIKPVTAAATTENKSTATKTKKKPTRATAATEAENKRVLAIAKQHLQATGKPPGRDLLVELSGCTSNRARIVLAMLKEQQQQKSVETENNQQPTKLELVQ